MTVLRFRTTEQSIHDRPQAQQILNPGDQFGVAPLLTGDVAGRHIRPLDGNKTSAAVRTKKEKLDFLPLTDLLQNFKGLALEYMRLAHDPDRGRKFVEMGSVSGSPSNTKRRRSRRPIRPPAKVAALRRNQWPLWIGIGGRFHRNAQEQCLNALEAAQNELERRQRDRPRQLDAAGRDALLALGEDLQRAWEAPTTTPRDKKELLRTVLEEVIVLAPRGEHYIRLTLRWKTGLLSNIELDRPKTRRATVRTDDDTIDLLRRLAQFHSDAMIARILNQQGKTTAYGHPFNVHRVGNLRRHWNIPCFDPATAPTDGKLVNIAQAARILGVATSTVHRWLNDGFIDGEQITPGAPWRIRITEAFRPRLMEQAPPGYVPMFVAMQRLGVTRQTVLQRVKRGELDAIHIRAGRKKALRIKVEDDHPSLFEQSS